MILQLLSMHYYTQTVLVIEVLSNYSDNSSYSIINTVLISD